MALILGLILTLSLTPAGPQVQKITPDPVASTLATRLLDALQRPDEAARLQAALPLLHPSLKTSDGAALRPLVARYAWRRASANAPRYPAPAQITAAHRGLPTILDEASGPRPGRQDSYFIARHPTDGGRPAPILIFWPADGGPPSVSDFGSL